jgi:hypothetical protein
MSNILIITTVYRTGEKIFPIIPELCKNHKVDVLNIGQMSNKTGWGGDIDVRQNFYKMCDNLNITSIHAPKFMENKNEMAVEYNKFFECIEDILKKNYYHIVIMDNNVTQKGVGLSNLYKWLNSQNIPVIGSPHGNKEFKGQRVLKKIGNVFDYSFVFGEKEKNKIIKYEGKYRQYSDRLIPSGIPSNDALKNYKRNNKYILIIPNFTTKQPHGSMTGQFSVFTKDVFYKMNILGLSQKMGMPIVVKEKVKMFYRDNSLLNDLSISKEVSFVRECEDDNELICNAAYVISAPSTMAFKSIQCGIPTVLLKGHGMIGNFYDYPGMINENEKEMNDSFSFQNNNGRFCDFIKNTLEGGIDYTSTKIYVDYINDIINRKIV